MITFKEKVASGRGLHRPQGDKGLIDNDGYLWVKVRLVGGGTTWGRQCTDGIVIIDESTNAMEGRLVDLEIREL